MSPLWQAVWGVAAAPVVTAALRVPAEMMLRHARYPEIARLLRARLMPWPAQWAANGAGALVVWLCLRAWWLALGGGVSVIAALAVWWWRRRKDRRKALAAWGAKALARLAAMVRTMRESAKPGPALRPVPGGAR